MHFIQYFALSSFCVIAMLFAGCSSDNTPTAANTSPSTAPITPDAIPHEPAILQRDIACDTSSNTELSPQMLAAVALAEQRYQDLLDKTAIDTLQYIDYTDTDGEWALVAPSRWTSGFLPGSLWYLYALTGDVQWKTAATESTAGLRALTTATDNDTGFQIFSAYGIGRKLQNGEWPEADTAISEAAVTLIEQRFNPDIGAFRAWPQRIADPFQISSAAPFEVNVDMIMNMEVVLSAANDSGSASQRSAAISHADVTWSSVMRADFSSYHVASFNAGGVLQSNRTHQGWVDESTWSRGQAWAVYGYEMLYRYTELPRMLERAESSYQYFKQATFDQSSHWIPYADFDAPIDIRNPRDSSATAIVASAAIALYEATGNTLYLQDANDMLTTLSEGFLSTNTAFESLLIAASEQYVREDDDTTPAASGYEVGASFGDFYFLEALYRLQHTATPSCL